MNSFNIIDEGQFSLEFFKQNVVEAQNRIISENMLTDYAFNVTRNSLSICYSVNGKDFEGNYLVYDISSNESKIGELKCFFANDFSFYDITASLS